jgi:hypothetical protein
MEIPDNIDVPSAIQCTLAVTSNEGASTDWQVVDAHHVRLRAAAVALDACTRLGLAVQIGAETIPARR